MKILIEFLPIIILFGLYKTYDIKTAVVGFMVVTVLLLLGKYFQTKKWDKVLLFSTVIAVVLGTISVVFDNPIFLQHRPTVFNSLMIIFLWGSYALYKKNWIEVIYSQVVTISSEVARTLLYGTIGFFLLMLILNLVLVATFDFESWLKIKYSSFFVLSIIFVIWQGWIIMKEQNNSEKNNALSDIEDIKKDS